MKSIANSVLVISISLWAIVLGIKMLLSAQPVGRVVSEGVSLLPPLVPIVYCAFLIRRAMKKL